MATTTQPVRKHVEEVRETLQARIRQIEDHELPRLRAAERALRDPARRGRPPKVRS